MYVALASMTMLFAASLVAYFVTRAQSPQWRSADMPGLPPGLSVSTVLLLLMSAALHFAERRLNENRFLGLQRGLSVALALALAFLLAQVQNWRTVASAALAGETKSLYEFTFYMLTALHAAHVVFGVGPLVWVLSRANRHHYSSSNSEGVRLTRQYWDFLLGVWIVLLVSLWCAT